MTVSRTLDVTGPVWVDCDPGIDDAFALVALSGLHRSGDVRLVGVSAVGGNVDVITAADNAALVLAQCELQDEVPLVIGADPPRRPPSTGFHGIDGLGGQYFSSRFVRGPIGDTDDMVMKHLQGLVGVTILCIGPLTNVARWSQLEEFVDLQPHIVAMGGTYDRGRGNVSKEAEFNFFCDPDAASLALTGNNPRVLIPLDVTEQVAFSAEDLGPIAKQCAWLGRMAQWSTRAHAALSTEREPPGTVWLHDLVACLQLVQPSLFSYQRSDVVLDEAERGATIIKPNLDGMVEIATNIVDPDQARERALYLVEQAIESVPRRLSVE